MLICPLILVCFIGLLNPYYWLTFLGVLPSITLTTLVPWCRQCSKATVSNLTQDQVYSANIKYLVRSGVPADLGPNLTPPIV